jgi:type II restriction/modification system DNA methylase subunit YeeA
METAKLKKFAQFARRSLLEQVSAKLKLVLAEDSAARRENPMAVAEIEKQIFGVAGKYTDHSPLATDHSHRRAQLVDRVAYIWFNRFCALRFMDVNRYTRIGVVSPAEGQFQPEILAEAKMGHIDEEMVHDKVRQQIFALLDGKAPSRDPQGEAYRLLVVAACNFWNKAMPFLFQRIDDYTELLMPDDLLSGNSILAYTREAMTPDACEDVEVIGWLYQFYISEKKDEVFDGLKKNKKITPENIPAATQLFTPHWIVRYLVENSLGRLWLLNRPNSRLKERMEYYIEPQMDTDGHRVEDNKNICVNPCESVVHISSPEEIKICDPACGSGHMLTYAFDLLYAIYEEEGYEPAEIPEKILTHNLYGIEIDERAGELAAFALTMKARAKQRRFFNRKAASGEPVEPNICVLENVHFDEGELKNYMDFVGRDLFTAPLQTTLRQFEEADNFGSLIRPDVTDVDGMLRILESKNVSGQLFISMTHQKVLQALRQADYLSPKYHVVIANPPYMGGKGMNPSLKQWAAKHYDLSKNDLYAMFIERSTFLCISGGLVAIIAMQGWMFLSRYEQFRASVLSRNTINSMAHFGERAFDSIGGAIVATSAFVAITKRLDDISGSYLRLVDGRNEREKSMWLREAAKDPNHPLRYHATTIELEGVPGSPLAYWLTHAFFNMFREFPGIGQHATLRAGMATGNNDLFVRFWSEIESRKFCPNAKSPEDFWASVSAKWLPFNKGGQPRKWYGNNDFVLSYDQQSYALLKESGNRCPSEDYYFRPCITWSDVTSGPFGVRYMPAGSVFSSVGNTLYPEHVDETPEICLSLCSKVAATALSVINPTLHANPGDVARIPYKRDGKRQDFEKLLSLARDDWDSYETSWDFNILPLLNPDYRQPTLKATYQNLRAHWREMTLEVQRLEEENNRIFIDAYGLQDELTPDVPLNEITLTCNPHYRYGGDKIEEELEALLLADTMRELVSYAVGCMFGRYALDKPGLILANQGETIEDYYKILNRETREKREKENDNFSDFRAFRGSISFPADEDNVIPLLDGDWFTDDISERFREFLKVAFGTEHYEENLRFVENALGKDIRKYFLKDFYSDHVKRYKKRPIYWLFSSPKGSFNALIYMHRYRPDTVSVVLNDYLREFRTKLTSHKNHLEAVSISASSSQGEKTKALKEIEKITKMIAEMEEYEREVLYPLATEQVEIDLDDGVKVNYPKLGSALKKIPGLDAKED